MTINSDSMNGYISDQGYLKESQYRNSDNLQARINLHRSFGTNGYAWQKWVFDHLDLQPNVHALEVGCGPGGLWFENVDRFPEGLNLTIGDLSIGMVRTARENIHHALSWVKNKSLSLRSICVDVQNIPFPDSYFDVVVANHMLYHAPDIHQSVRELRRVVKPGGRVVTATNGYGHMRQLGEILSEFLPSYRDGHRTQVRRYALENAPQLLLSEFGKVETFVYEDHLHITQTQPLLDYIGSLWDTFQPDRKQVIDDLTNLIQEEIDRVGYFLIEKSQGILVAYP